MHVVRYNVMYFAFSIACISKCRVCCELCYNKQFVVHAVRANCILITMFSEVDSPMTRILNRLNIDLDENDENAMDCDT